MAGGPKHPQQNTSSAGKRLALVGTIGVFAGGAAVLVGAAGNDSSDQTGHEANWEAAAASADYGSMNHAMEDRIPVSGQRTATITYESADALAARFEANSFQPEYDAAERATEDRNSVGSVDHGSADALAQRTSDSEALTEASADRAAKGYYQDTGDNSIESGDYGSADAAEQSLKN